MQQIEIKENKRNKEKRLINSGKGREFKNPEIKLGTNNSPQRQKQRPEQWPRRRLSQTPSHTRASARSFCPALRPDMGQWLDLRCDTAFNQL